MNQSQAVDVFNFSECNTNGHKSSFNVVDCELISSVLLNLYFICVAEGHTWIM